MSEEGRMRLLVEAVQPYLERDYVIYGLGTTWAVLERRDATDLASALYPTHSLLGSIAVASHAFHRDRYVEIVVQPDGRVTTNSGSTSPAQRQPTDR